MQLLTILTLIYVAVLVLALAVSLIAILIYLRRIAGVLSEVHEALNVVSERSEPLKPHLEELDRAVTGIAEEIHQSQKSLETAEHQLAETLQRHEKAGLAR